MVVTSEAFCNMSHSSDILSQTVHDDKGTGSLSCKDQSELSSP